MWKTERDGEETTDSYKHFGKFTHAKTSHNF